MSQEFKPGDEVELKVGGPRMVVSGRDEIGRYILQVVRRRQTRNGNVRSGNSEAL